MKKSIYITYMGLTEPLLYSQVLNYLKGLSRKGIPIYIVSFEKKGFLKKEAIEKIRQDLWQYGIKWFFLKYHKSPQFLSKPFDMIAGIFFITYLTLKENVGIIHARGTFCALMSIVPKLLLGKKMIFDVRGLMAEEYVDAELWKRNSFAYKIISKLEYYFINKSDAIVVLTNRIKNVFLNTYKAKNISVIPTCVDLENFKFNPVKPQGDRFTLIYAGAVGSWYMLTEMVDFFEVLCRSGKNAKFIVLSQIDKRMFKKSIPYPIRDKIIIESIEPQRVSDYLNTADAGIFFIKPCFSKIASCPTKFAEYLACGLPVVINSRIGDTDDVVRDNKIGVVVEKFDIEGYEKAIIGIKKLLREGSVLRQRCRDVAERCFSLEEGVNRYFKIYGKL